MGTTVYSWRPSHQSCSLAFSRPQLLYAPLLIREANGGGNHMRQLGLAGRNSMRGPESLRWGALNSCLLL